MALEITPRSPLPAPNGMTEVRVDEKGRLTLPAGHKRFLESLDENRLFVTSLDDRRVHVFSQSVWRSRQERMIAESSLQEVVRRFLFRVHRVGADTEMDKQGRLVLPARLRARLRLEDTMVAVWAAIDRVEIMRDDEAEALDREFNSTRESDYALLENVNLI